MVVKLQARRCVHRYGRGYDDGIVPQAARRHLDINVVFCNEKMAHLIE